MTACLEFLGAGDRGAGADRTVCPPRLDQIPRRPICAAAAEHASRAEDDRSRSKPRSASSQGEPATSEEARHSTVRSIRLAPGSSLAPCASTASSSQDRTDRGDREPRWPSSTSAGELGGAGERVSLGSARADMNSLTRRDIGRLSDRPSLPDHSCLPYTPCRYSPRRSPASCTLGIALINLLVTSSIR
ncbi:hypothetical protein FA95DRAFT_981687 [Auriscalpium vulgare]|uniref:Uncharacterized protein n=1 Tax=Auriscalpium vulgare TaxID=40419 RepID=A0ACB8R6V6_9AGAM|nr:hypothetical protein FA95DRAFT_981687 [Auriscalpium vulgare]